MTARREASPPPALPGYEYVRVLGLGGFADVFLYQQDLPRREVAVKVLLAGSLDDEVRGRFQTEANLMAQLSHHPAIVTIHQAAIAADGRPYLVMEYCSGPGLAERYRTERISVAETLRIGIRLASAVETAHRAGILHRDIKPANVLTTDFGWPALTDFGIAATAGKGGATVGMSIPWSPPELLGEHPDGDERSDVYSLAATLYSLLAGRTPFEVPGTQNTAQQLVARIERSPLPPTGRDDVPPALFDVLRRAMAKHPVGRYPSAAALAHALQQVEQELHLPVTPLDLPDVAVEAEAPVAGPLTGEAAEATRLRSILTVTPQTEDAPAAPAPSEPRAIVFDTGPSAPPPGPDRSRTVVAVASGVVVLGAVVALGAVALQHRGPADGPTGGTDFTAGSGSTGGAGSVPAPTGLSGTRAADGSVTFTWENPEPEPGDRYLWGVLTTTGRPTLELVDDARVTLPATDGEICIEVSVVRADRRASDRPAEACVA